MAALLTESPPLTPPDPLRQVLLRCLEGLTPCVLPGVDGMTLSDVLRDYRRMAAGGLVPDRVQLTRRHPELAGEFAAFFSPFERG